MSVTPLSATNGEPGCFYERLDDKLRAQRVPFSGTFELTLGCNFQCPHCYLTGLPSPGPELDPKRIEGLLDEMAAAGCLGLTLTGGEPLLSPVFAEVWRAAHRRGFLLSLFTNASLVSKRIADLLADHPPRLVEVSLYGASRETYARVTGRGEHFDASLDGLDRLLDRGLDVVAKAILLAPLAADATGLNALAKQRGLTLRFDPGIDPRLDGDPAPTELRLDPRQAVDLELSDSQLRAARTERLAGLEGAPGDFACGAVGRSFHLDPAGTLMPCLLVREPRVSVVQTPFAQAWEQLGDAPPIAFGPDSPCKGCQLHPVCSFCPGLELSLERAGRERDYYCQVARERLSVLGSGGWGA